MYNTLYLVDHKACIENQRTLKFNPEYKFSKDSIPNCTQESKRKLGILREKYVNGPRTSINIV